MGPGRAPQQLPLPEERQQRRRLLARGQAPFLPPPQLPHRHLGVIFPGGQLHGQHLGQRQGSQGRRSFSSALALASSRHSLDFSFRLAKSTLRVTQGR